MLSLFSTLCNIFDTARSCYGVINSYMHRAFVDERLNLFWIMASYTLVSIHLVINCLSSSNLP